MIKELRIKVGDDEIYGKLYLPPEARDLVILSHGLSLNHTFMIPYARKLYDKGIASYAFDFRGGGYDSKSTGSISDMTLDSERDDLNSVIDYFSDKTCNIYLAGHSQGGLISSLVAPQRKDDIRAIFLFAPAYVIPNDMTENPRREKNVLNLMPEHLGDKYIECAKNTKVYDEMLPFDKEVFIFHGKNDERVPLGYSQKADILYPNSTLIVYDDEHRFTDENKDKVVSRISDVINHH